MNTQKLIRKLKKLAEITTEWTGSKQPNHTFGYAVKSIKSKPRQCELACGKMVNDQVIGYMYNSYNDKHRWFKKCETCGLWQDPKTNEMKEAKILRGVFMQIHGIKKRQD